MEPIYRKAILLKKQYLDESIQMNNLRDSIIRSKIFTNNMVNDLFDPNSELDFFDELCTRGPEALPRFLEILECHDYKQVAKHLRDTATKFSKPYFYKMNSKPLGLCMIINNENFDDPKRNRVGSHHLANELEQFFKKIGYCVFPREKTQDLRACTMQTRLEELSQMPDLERVDSCVVFIATHGDKVDGEYVLYGVDNDYVYYNNIFTLFDNSKCKKLLHKPKMFFFQTCRGDSEYDVNDSMNTAVDAMGYNMYPARESTSSPFITDLLLAHSTLPGYSSYQYWFVEELLYVFSENYMEHDVATMLEIVSGRVSQRQTDYHTVQAVHIENFCVGKIHFNRKEEQD